MQIESERARSDEALQNCHAQLAAARKQALMVRDRASVMTSAERPRRQRGEGGTVGRHGAT